MVVMVGLVELIDVLQVIQQLLDALVAVRGLRLDAVVQDVLHAVGESGLQLPGGDELVGGLIGALPGEEVVHGDAQGINIRPGVGLGGAELLRRGVALGADVGGVGVGILLILPGDAEVDELQAAVRLQHDVGGLHIPVDDGVGFLVVEVVQHAAEVPEPLQARGLIHLALALEDGLQGLALHVVFHDEDVLGVLEDIHDAGQHGVLQAL